MSTGWAMLGYANQRVDHYWKEGESGRYVHSLCGRIATRSYVHPESYSGLPRCKTCEKKL